MDEVIQQVVMRLFIKGEIMVMLEEIVEKELDGVYGFEKEWLRQAILGFALAYDHMVGKLKIVIGRIQGVKLQANVSFITKGSVSY